MDISPAFLAANVAGWRWPVWSTLTASAFDATDLFMSAMNGEFPGSASLAGDPASRLPTSHVRGLAPTGRNMTLNDPEAAYNMMTAINNKEVYYKAQFFELGAMRSALSALRNTAQDLDMTAPTAGDDIHSQLQGFVDQYNRWVRQFGADTQPGGLLADTRAAQVARRELDQSLENIFNGAKDGLHGLKDIGIKVDPASGLAALDTAKLDTVLTTNRQGVADAVAEFSANFAEAARLLNADGNFMPRQLDNLKRAIQYIADNSSALQAEFGTGDAAKPSGKIAQAVAAYNRTYAI